MNLNRALDGFPDPWNPRFVVLLVSASVVTAAVAALRAGSDAILPGVIALVAALLATIGRLKLNATADARARSLDAADASPLSGFLLLGAGCALALATLAFVWESGLEWVAVTLPFFILALCQSCFKQTGALPLIIVPLLFGLIFLDTAILMGQPAAGGYPAVFAVVLVLVGLTTRRLENRFETGAAAANETLVHPVHRSTLAWLSTLFFLFGVITLWPWLGKMYGVGYFWILILGVLSPLLYLWGRMKQPGADTPLPALNRFNRLLPYIGLILLVAILIG